TKTTDVLTAGHLDVTKTTDVLTAGRLDVTMTKDDLPEEMMSNPDGIKTDLKDDSMKDAHSSEIDRPEIVIRDQVALTTTVRKEDHHIDLTQNLHGIVSGRHEDSMMTEDLKSVLEDLMIALHKIVPREGLTMIEDPKDVLEDLTIGHHKTATRHHEDSMMTEDLKSVLEDLTIVRHGIVNDHREDLVRMKIPVKGPLAMKEGQADMKIVQIRTGLQDLTVMNAGDLTDVMKGPAMLTRIAKSADQKGAADQNLMGSISSSRPEREGRMNDPSGWMM
ncbi:MAG: hypothetical protein WCY44_06950, partial [Sphaerochaetaceae bacterium]